jgi:APA family basic amino acid/polyamine antiporter
VTFIRRLTQTKSLDSLLAETEGEGHALNKVLGPWSLIALGIGAIIGTGIFATIGTAVAGDSQRLGAGPGVMISFVLTAVVCGFTALCYAELASMVPIGGSAYTYSYATLGELVAWIIGWDLIIEYAIGNVAVAITWAGYTNELLHQIGVHLPAWLTVDYRSAAQKMPDVIAAAPHIAGVPLVFNVLAASIVGAITVVLVWGVRESTRFNSIMVGVKLLVLAFFVFVGWRYMHAENMKPFAPNGFKGIREGAAVIFFAYIGFDAVSTCAEECKNPKRDMPIGIIGSLIICTIVYVILSAVFVGMLPFSALVGATPEQRAEPLTFAMVWAHMPGWMVGIVAFGSIIAQTAVLLVYQLGQPRIFLAMARDGLLPPFFARIHPRFKTPHASTILTGVVVGALAGVANIDEMVDLTNIGTLFAFLLVCIGVMVLRFREPARARGFRVPFGPVLVPLLGAASCVFLIRELPGSSFARFGVWLLIGLVFYGLYGYWRSRLRVRAS